MRPKRFVAPVVLALLVGCGPSIPNSSRLATGSEALVHDEQYNTATIYGEKGTGEYGVGWLRVPVGTKVRIVSDTAESKPAGPTGVADKDVREVRVLILEGEYRGNAGTIRRQSLRPAPK